MAAHAPSLLPDDVLVAILVRLPPCSIGRSRAVCRAWRAATTHPSFDRALAQRPPAVAKLTSQVVAVIGNFGSTFNFDLFRGRWHRGNTTAAQQKTAGSPWTCCPRAITLARSQSQEHELFRAGVIVSRLLGSWDGVVVVLCLWRRYMLQPLYHKAAAAEYYALWNPLTHACATVPGPAGGGGRSFGVIGGYAHPETRRFHLLHSSCEAVPGRDDLMAPVTFRILRVGGDATWRELPFPPLHDKDNTSIFMRSDRARDRHVSVHGNLHWLVQSGATGTVALLVFDTARDKFRVMAAPERRPGLRLETARIVLWSGKLCVLALASKASSAAGTMEMWVLDVDDYGSDSDPAGASWRLRRRIRMVRLDGADLSPAFMAATTVEVVEGVEEGEEIFLRLGDRIDAYNLREDAWRKVSVAKHASPLMHRVSVLRPEMSFAEAARVLVPRTGLLGSLYHCCFREGHEGY